MKEIVFSETNIKNLINSNNLDSDTIVDQFLRKNLISLARYTDCAGLPWGSWKNVSQTIDQYLLSENWQYMKSSDSAFNNNVSYFAPSSFIKLSLPVFISILNDFNQQQINQTLSQEIITSYIYEILTQDLSDIIIDKISDDLFVNILLSLSNKAYFDKSQELILIRKFIDLNNDRPESFSKKLVKKRLKSLESIEEEEQKDNSSLDSIEISDIKVALIITGQLRGFETSIPRIAEKFKNLKNTDVYISTWEDVGYTRFNLQSTYRIFDEETCNYIYTNKDHLSLNKFDYEISKLTKERYSKDAIIQIFNQKLKSCKNIFFNIKKHTEYPYKSMSNSEKMYFHNCYWVETLGLDYFSDYDLIIKIRPDYFLKNLDVISEIQEVLKKKAKHIISDTSGYLFQEWGFGMGDQFWIGKPDSIIPILKCHSKNSMSYKYMEYFYPKDTYQGHINCGAEAWLNGVSLLSTPSTMLKSRLVSTRLLSFTEFKNMELEIK